MAGAGFMALTTAARVRQRLGLPTETGGADLYTSEIASLITEVELQAMRFCGLAQWESAAYDENHNGTGDDALYLRVPYMDSVSSVTILSAGEPITVPATTYRLDSETACLILSTYYSWTETYSCWPEGVRNIRVQGTGGLAAVPEDLTLAITAMVCAALQDRHTALSTTQFATDGVQRTMRTTAEIVEAYGQLLAPWKRVYA